MNSKYERGRRFEYEVMKMLKELGFETTRTAGSHSPFDVIAWKTNELKKIMGIVFVQCKTTKDINKSPETALKT